MNKLKVLIIGLADWLDRNKEVELMERRMKFKVNWIDSAADALFPVFYKLVLNTKTKSWIRRIGRKPGKMIKREIKRREIQFLVDICCLT